MFSSSFTRAIVNKVLWSRAVNTTAVTCGSLKPPESLLTLQGISRDRTEVIPLETSQKYLKSSAYQQTYGDEPVWKLYRRNYRGLRPPRKTRKTCIRNGQISTGSPCPICRDEYLVLHEHNTELLKQFVSSQTGAVLSYSQTGLCQKKHQELLVVIERAKDIGVIEFDVPLRKYNYSDYYTKTE